MTAALLYCSRNTTLAYLGGRGGNKRFKHKAPRSENQISVLCPTLKSWLQKIKKGRGGWGGGREKCSKYKWISWMNHPFIRGRATQTHRGTPVDFRTPLGAFMIIESMRRRRRGLALRSAGALLCPRRRTQVFIRERQETSAAAFCVCVNHRGLCALICRRVRRSAL